MSYFSSHNHRTGTYSYTLSVPLKPYHQSTHSFNPVPPISIYAKLFGACAQQCTSSDRQTACSQCTAAFQKHTMSRHICTSPFLPTSLAHENSRLASLCTQHLLSLEPLPLCSRAQRRAAAAAEPQKHNMSRKKNKGYNRVYIVPAPIALRENLQRAAAEAFFPRSSTII